MQKRASRLPGPARRKRPIRAVAPSLRYKDWLIKSLKDPKEAAAYLEAAIEDDDEAGIIRALRNVAEAFGGIARIARAAKLNREVLNRSLAAGGNPELRTLTAILRAAGLRLSVTPVEKRAASPGTGRR